MRQKVEDMISQDRRIKVNITAHELGISGGTVSSIIHKVSMMSNVSSTWVPRMLALEQKACPHQFSEENLDKPRANPEEFSRIITGDGTWVHHHDPETRQESMQWKHKGSPTLSRKDHGNSFLTLKRCSAFGIRATQDNHDWRHL